MSMYIKIEDCLENKISLKVGDVLEVNGKLYEVASHKGHCCNHCDIKQMGKDCEVVKIIHPFMACYELLSNRFNTRRYQNQNYLKISGGI